MKKKDVKGCAGCLIVFFGLSFALTSVGLILSLAMGYELSEYFLRPDGESGYEWWQAQFWIVVIAAVVLLAVGGKFQNISINGYTEDKEEKRKR